MLFPDTSCCEPMSDLQGADGGARPIGTAEGRRKVFLLLEASIQPIQFSIAQQLELHGAFWMRVLSGSLPPHLASWSKILYNEEAQQVSSAKFERRSHQQAFKSNFLCFSLQSCVCSLCVRNQYGEVISCSFLFVFNDSVCVHVVLCLSFKERTQVGLSLV